MKLTIFFMVIWAIASPLAWMASTKMMEAENKRDVWHHITNGQWLFLRIMSCLPVTNFAVLMGCGEYLINDDSPLVKWIKAKRNFK